jgi:hypothetical protein
MEPFDRGRGTYELGVSLDLRRMWEARNPSEPWPTARLERRQGLGDLARVLRLRPVGGRVEPRSTAFPVVPMESRACRDDIHGHHPLGGHSPR